MIKQQKANNETKIKFQKSGKILTIKYLKRQERKLWKKICGREYWKIKKIVRGILIYKKLLRKKCSKKELGFDKNKG